VSHLYALPSSQILKSRRFAEQKKATPAQIALAWLLAKKPWIVPIRLHVRGTKGVKQNAQNIAQSIAEDNSQTKVTPNRFSLP
jgi:aryl-alcohol dehydrogenase-like predicted oxidoreductase